MSVVRYRAAKDVEIMQTVGVYSRLEGYYGSRRSIVLVRNCFTDFLGDLVKQTDFFRPRIEPGVQPFRLCVQMSASMVTV